jgi:hypothetical protein
VEKEDLYIIKSIIYEYGATTVLKGIIQAMEECADEYSDLGLKEQARSVAEMAERLASLTNPKLRAL